MQKLIEELENISNSLKETQRISKEIHTIDGSGEAVETRTTFNAQGQGTQCRKQETIEDGQIVDTKQSCKPIQGLVSAKNQQTRTQNQQKGTQNKQTGTQNQQKGTQNKQKGVQKQNLNQQTGVQKQNQNQQTGTQNQQTGVQKQNQNQQNKNMNKQTAAQDHFKLP